MLRIILKYIKIFFWLSIFVSMIILFMPGGTQPGLPYIDKIAHFLLFGGLSWLGLKSYQSVFTIISSLIVYTILAEFIQYFFILNRGLEFMDAVMGIVGIGAGLLLYKILN